MVQSKDAEFLTTAIALELCVRENDMQKAQELCRVINGKELDAAQKISVTSAVTSPIDEYDPTSAEVIRYLIKNLDCIESKDEDLRMLDAVEVFQSNDQEKESHFLDEAVSPDMFRGMGDQYGYARMMILICRKARRFDKMREISSYMQGVS